MRKLRGKQRDAVETSRSGESISEGESFPWSEEGEEEGKHHNVEHFITEEITSPREHSALSEGMDGWTEDSTQDLEEAQVEGDISLEPSLSQENVMVQEKEKEEKKEEEEAEEENGEEEKKEEGKEEEEEQEQEPESLFMAEVGREWIYALHGESVLCSL